MNDIKLQDITKRISTDNAKRANYFNRLFETISYFSSKKIKKERDLRRIKLTGVKDFDKLNPEP